MHLNEIRRRIDALRRKLALELAVIELHRLVCEFALKWGIALAGDQPVPEPHTFPSKVAATGVKLTSHMGAVKYLEECRTKNNRPRSPEAALPAAALRPGLPLQCSPRP